MAEGGLEDIFESALNLENSHLVSGYEEGFREGVEIGKREGKELGLERGFLVGEEVGFYMGCVWVWKKAMASKPAVFPQRAQKVIAAFERELKTFPLGNAQDEAIGDLIAKLRMKHRGICLMLGLPSLEYPGLSLGMFKDTSPMSF